MSGRNPQPVSERVIPAAVSATEPGGTQHAGNSDGLPVHQLLDDLGGADLVGDLLVRERSTGRTRRGTHGRCPGNRA